MTTLRDIASDLHRVYHLADVDPGHPIRRAHDALVVADGWVTAAEMVRDELLDLRANARRYHRRMQQAEGACARHMRDLQLAPGARPASFSRALSMAAWRSVEDENAELRQRLATAEAQRDALCTAINRHNDGCAEVCESHRKAGRCDAYLSRNLVCPDCPHDDMINLDAALAAGMRSDD